MNVFWREVPFLRLLIPLAAGIGVHSRYSASSPIPVWIGLICIMATAIAWMYLPLVKRLAYPWVAGIGIQLCCFGLGYQLSEWHHAPSSSFWYRHADSSASFMLIQVEDMPERKPKTYKINARITEVIGGQGSKRVHGKTWLYLWHSAKASRVREGDYLLIRNTLKDIPVQTNPGAWDYASYSKRKGYYQTAFLQDHQWVFSGKYHFGIASFFSKLGQQTCAVLKRVIHHPEALGIAEALLIGYRQDISKELWQAYSNTGIVHIIAISGMHMALLYGGIRWLLLRLTLFKSRRYFAVIIALLLMWCFACITGLPPSVFRAALMFTFLGIGDLLNRSAHPVNNLAASAFLLLCIKPVWLFDIGFQLSYAAVLSLIVFYAHIYRSIYFTHKIPDAIWKLMAATLAAQILTFPLCLYYFHQFPSLFILTNLIAIPVTTFVLYAEIMLVLMQWIKPVAVFLGYVIESVLNGMNHVVFRLANWPYVAWTGISISIFQVILLFLCVISITVYFRYRKQYQLYSILLICLLLMLFGLQNRYQTITQRKLIVYDGGKAGVLDVIHGATYFNPDEDSISNIPSLMQYVMKPSRIFYHATKPAVKGIAFATYEGIEIIQVEQTRIVRLHHTHFQIQPKLQVNYLILSKHAQPDPDWLTKHIHADILILDSSFRTREREAYKYALRQTGLQVYDVMDEGAFVADL